MEENLNKLFEKFQNSIIVISYGEPGNPSIEKIGELLLQYKSEIMVAKTEYKYRLNRKNGKEMREVLMIGR